MEEVYLRGHHLNPNHVIFLNPTPGRLLPEKEGSFLAKFPSVQAETEKKWFHMYRLLQMSRNTRDTFFSIALVGCMIINLHALGALM